jgi:hypothetical protein
MLTTHYRFRKSAVLANLDQNKKLISYEIKPDNEDGYRTMSVDLHSLRLAIDELDDLVTK